MEISEVNKPVLNFNNLSGFWKAIVSSQSELFHDQSSRSQSRQERADDRRDTDERQEGGGLKEVGGAL